MIISRTHTSDRVLSELWGGLGDALQFSTLPELYNAQLGLTTYLSNSYVSRNPEITDLVWGANPFVAGWSSLSPNSGSVVKYRYRDGLSFVGSIEKNHGLNPVNDAPKIYYVPCRDPQLAGKTLVDLSAVTLSKGPFFLAPEALSTWISRETEGRQHGTLLEAKFLNLGGQSPTNDGPDFIRPLRSPFDDQYEIRSLFQLVDAIGSVDRFIGLHSGSVALAAAVKRFNPRLEITCLLSKSLDEHPKQRLQKVHRYSGVDYTPI